jgi:hypothetical protein
MPETRMIYMFIFMIGTEVQICQGFHFEREESIWKIILTKT